MHDSPGGSGRVILLVVLLLLTCWFADWTDDYQSYLNSTRYSAFQSANGRTPIVSGGAMSGGSAMMAMALRSASAGAGLGQTSALESVFGGPLGSPSNASDDSRSARSGRDMLSNSGAGVNSTGNGLSVNRFGASGSNSGLGMGLSGSTSGLGTSGSYGLGSTGSSFSSFPQ